MFTRGMRSGLLGLSLTVALGACGSSGEDQLDLNSCTKCDTYGGKSWVINMKKASADATGYGATGKYFWGVVIGEELRELNGVDQLLDPADQAATQLFQGIFKDTDVKLVGATFKIIWDQLRNIKEGYPTLIFKDVTSAHRGIVMAQEFFKAQYSQEVAYQIVVIDADGNYVAAPGTQNIIPMLKETAPENQTHIRQAMQNGDVISYVHPEYTDMKNLMERRASHVAMHYDLKLDNGRELVHHIDNPNGYGPMYNHKPNRHMPFHAWRNKAETTELAARYGLAARNWAMMLNDISPFAGFFDLQLKTYQDLDRFVEPAMNGEELPKLYCSGLAYASLNLGLNRPQTQAGLGNHYSKYLSKGEGTDAEAGWFFSDADQRFGESFLSQGLEGLTAKESLVFEPYDSVDLLNSWVDNTFRGLPAQLSDVLPAEVVAGIKQGIEGQLAQVAGDAEMTAKLQMVLGLYSAPQFRMAVIKSVLGTADFQKQVVGGFRALEWGEPVRALQEGEVDRTASMPPATVSNAALWAAAWGLPAETKNAFMADTCQFIKGLETACDNSKVVDTQYGKMSLLNAAESKQSEALAEAVTEAETPMDVVKALARYGITNRFVPPRIWIDYGEGQDARMNYVGTVINCELLSAMDGSDVDACLGSGGKVEYYKEGGSDSHTYPHFAVRAGGQVTHRRVDGSNGPAFFGLGTKVGVKFTALDPSKIIFALHVPAQWHNEDNDALVEDTFTDAVWDYGDVCTEHQQAETLTRTCAPKWGLALRPDLGTSPVLVKDLTFDLLKDANCEIIDDNSMECDLVAQTVINGRTEILTERGTVDRRTTNGYFVATMINTGEATGQSECELRRDMLGNVNFAEDTSALMGCSDKPGSAHFDVWRIELWNRAE